MEPNDWEELISPEGQTFFFNRKTEESSWDPPACLKSAPLYVRWDFFVLLESFGSIRAHSSFITGGAAVASTPRRGLPDWYSGKRLWWWLLRGENQGRRGAPNPTVGDSSFLSMSLASALGVLCEGPTSQARESDLRYLGQKCWWPCTNRKH